MKSKNPPAVEFSYKLTFCSPNGFALTFSGVAEWKLAEGIYKIVDASGELLGIIPETWAMHQFKEYAHPPFVPVNITPLKP